MVEDEQVRTTEPQVDNFFTVAMRDGLEGSVRAGTIDEDDEVETLHVQFDGHISNMDTAYELARDWYITAESERLNEE